MIDTLVLVLVSLLHTLVAFGPFVLGGLFILALGGCFLNPRR